MEDGVHYLWIIFLLILSAFFSGSETAFFSLNKIHLKKLEKEDSKSGKRVKKLIAKPRKLLITILLGNTVVNVFASTIATIIALNIKDRYFPDSTELVVTVEIVLMTIALLIFGEFTPKLFAYTDPERFSRYGSPVITVIQIILYPVIVILELINNLFAREKKSHSSNDVMTTEDIRNLIQSKNTDNTLEEDEKQIIDNIFRLPGTEASEIMIPRVDIVAVDIADGMDNLINTINESGHSRIPIYKKNIDDIIGFVYAKDIILQSEKQKIGTLLRKPLIVTENMGVDKLLNFFKKTKVHIAVVVDEYGGTSGLISMEDILEELFGEIMDEHDNEDPIITQLDESEYIINGMIPVSEINEKFHLDIDDDFDNIASFLYSSFNKVPDENEVFSIEHSVEFTILKVEDNRINSIKMRLISDESPD